MLLHPAPARAPVLAILILTTLVSGLMAGEASTYLEQNRRLLEAFSTGVRTMEFACTQVLSNAQKEGVHARSVTQTCHAWLDGKRSRFELVTEQVGVDGRSAIDKTLILRDGHQRWYLDLQDNVARVCRQSAAPMPRWDPPLLIFLGAFQLLQRGQGRLFPPFMANPPLPLPGFLDEWTRSAPLATPHGTVQDVDASNVRITAPFAVEGSRFEDRITVGHQPGRPLALTGLVCRRASCDAAGAGMNEATILTITVQSLRDLRLPQGLFPVPERLTLAMGPITTTWRLDACVINPALDDELFILDPSAAIAILDEESGRYVVDHR